MAVTVYIPTPFRRLTGNRTYVEAQGATWARCWPTSTPASRTWGN
ncbi:MAG: hypothetical protein U0531_09980 [Dehalococcoidia bacterium]